MRKAVIVAVLASMMLLAVAPAVMAQVELHGFMQARIAVTKQDYTVRMDRWGFRLQQVIDEEFDWLTEIYVHPYPAPVSQVYMESAYINWHLKDRLPWDFTVRFGKGRNYTFGITPSYGNRRTTDYTLFSEAYTQSRVQGIQTFSQFGNIQIAIAILNPYTVALGRNVPDMPTGMSIRLPLGDNENADNSTKRVALSGRAGYMDEVEGIGAVNVGASLYISETGAVPSGVDNEIQRFAVDGEVKTPMGILVQGQALMGSTAGLDQSGFEILGGWENTQCGLYARYGQVGYDDVLQGLNQVMLSAIYKIRPTVHLRLEGLINGEDTDAAKGWMERDNNVLYFETLFAW